VTVSFLMILTHKKNYAQGSGFNPQIVVSFFNELVTERKTMIKALGSIPKLLFHFLTSLLQRGTLCSKLPFHFLTSLLQRKETILMTSVSFFNDLSTKK
jgi:hypothetical protein